MPASPYSSVQKAREQLAARLVEVRKDAGINSRELARRLGWYESKVSRIANAITPPSEDDIRAWCEACGADQENPGLIASLRLAEGAYVEWRRMERAGLRAAQESVLPLYERTRRFRAYSSSVLPGMIQTRAYTTAVLRNVQSLRGLVDDVEEAVEARMDRQRLLDARGKVFAFVLEEQVLWTQVADEETMAGQLGHLLTIMATRPNVSLGIIPRTARMPWAETGFEVKVHPNPVRLVTGFTLRAEVAYLAEYIGGAYRPDSKEVLDARFFDIDELPDGLLPQQRDLIEHHRYPASPMPKCSPWA